MKFLYKTFVSVLLIFTVSSCQDKLDEINVDPDTFPRANDAQVLTAAEGFLGVIVDVDLNQGSFLWAQYYTWGLGVSIGNQERYVSEPDDFNGYWGRAYSNTLTDLKFLTKSNSAAYRGVAKVLQAYVYQGLVDHFGDIPYSEAVSGDEGILAPNYDDAAEVYANLVLLLDEAIDEFVLAEDLDQADDIGAEDFIYGGDLDLWTKFAYSLKLRVLMRTSETDAQQAAVEALITDGVFIETLADMPEISFTDIAGSQNPMWAIMEAGVGNFYFASNASLNVLEDLDDPRDTLFYTKVTTGTFTGELRGIDQGTVDEEPFTAPSSDYSGASLISVAPDNSVILMSPWEVWFLRAEAAARYGTSDNEETAFETAIQANFDYLGLDEDAGPDYIESLGYNIGASLDDRIDMIAVQKWISMNGTQEDEGWIEARRFDRPASRLFTQGIWQEPPLSVLDGEFPSAWLIPSSERSLNRNAPAQRTLTDFIFWDN